MGIIVKIQPNKEKNLSVGEVAKKLLETRTYKNKDGEEVKLTEIVFELIDLKPEKQKTIYSHEKFDLVKTHFAVKRQTKEERDAKADTLFVGEGISQIWKGGNSAQDKKAESDKQADETDLPF